MVKLPIYNSKKDQDWYLLPTAFWGNERLPFTGIVEKKFPNGQNFNRSTIFNGLLHGVSNVLLQKVYPFTI